MKPLRFHPEASQELRATVVFYRDESPGLGREFVRQVRIVLERIGEWPESGSPEEEKKEIRRASLRRFPITIVYRVGREVVEVLAVMHQRQRPGYWRDRL